MKKIRDERLILRNLQNIKILYIVQTLGILIILAMDLAEGGMDAVRANPLFLLFLISGVASAYLSINSSVDMEKPKKTFKRSFFLSLIIWFLLSLTIGYFVSVSEESDIGTGILIGAIVFICAVVPFTYIYRLRKKAWEEWEEDV